MGEVCLHPRMVRDLHRGMKSRMNGPRIGLTSSTQKRIIVIWQHINGLDVFRDRNITFDSVIGEDSTRLRCELGHSDRERFDGFRLASIHPYKRAWHSSLGEFGGRFSLSALSWKDLATTLVIPIRCQRLVL